MGPYLLFYLFAVRSSCSAFYQFSEFNEFLNFFATAQRFECLFLFYIFRLQTAVVTDTADAVNNTRALDALAEASNQVQRVFVVSSRYLDVYHRWKYLTTRPLFGQRFP